MGRPKIPLARLPDHLPGGHNKEEAVRNGILAVSLAALALASPAVAEDFRVITTDALAAKMSGPPANWDFTLVDARTQVEFSESHIPGAVLVPARLVTTRLPDVKALDGGILRWQADGLSVSR